MRKKIGLSVLLLFVAFMGNAQNDFTLYQMKAVPQVVSVNPAARPFSKLNIGLPLVSAIYLGVGNSGFAYEDFVKINSDNSLSIEMDDAIAQMNERNRLSTYLRTDIFSLGFKVGNNYISMGVTDKINLNFTYPKDLFKLAWEGNASSDFIGQRIAFDGLGVDFLHFTQYSFGINRRVTPSLSIGGRINYLVGHEALYTKQSDIGITTDAYNYGITADASIEINTSIDTAVTKTFIDSNSTQQDLINFYVKPSTLQNYFVGSSNNGYSLDFGFNYNLFDVVTFSGSVIDLGSITWTAHTANYTVEDKEFTFEGINLFDIVDPLDSTSSGPSNAFVGPLLDSVLSTFTDIQRTTGDFSTALNTQIYLGVQYHLSNRLRVGVLSRSQIVRGKMVTSSSVSLNTTIRNIISLSANYSIQGGSYGNIGLGMSASLGPLQIYVITDNVMSFIQWYNTRVVHTRFGLNFTFGKDYE